MKYINPLLVFTAILAVAIPVFGQGIGGIAPGTYGAGEWKGNAADFASLPTCDGDAEDDIRLTEDTDKLWRCASSTWGEITHTVGGVDVGAAYVWTGEHDFGGGGIEVENGTTPPACTVGQLYVDTDATAGQQLMACEAGAFVLQGDGGGVHTHSLTDVTDSGTLAALSTVGAGEISTDGVSADELNALGVEAELEAVIDLADLQERAHASLTGVGATDHHTATVDTGPSPDCTGSTTYQDGEGGCDTANAGTDITADLEEEAHKAEHEPSGADEIELLQIANGTTQTSISATVSESAGDVIVTMEASGGGDILFFFSTGDYAYDATPATTVTLTEGTATVPAMNYVYVLESNKTLTASTSGWPGTEYAPIGTFLVQTDVEVAAQGPLKVHLWTDHLYDSANTGHIGHTGFWIRHQPATWWTGGAQTYAITPNGGGVDNVLLTHGSGTALQMHEHVFDALANPSEEYWIVNPSSGDGGIEPYDRVTDLSSILEINDGTAITNNRRFSLVIWLVVSELGTDSKLMINLPTCTYGSDADATTDANDCDVYTIPTSFVGTGVLLSRWTMKYTTASSGTWTSVNEQDLRGQIPSTAAGGTSGGGVAEDDIGTVALNDAADTATVGHLVAVDSAVTTQLEYLALGTGLTSDGDTVSADLGTDIAAAEMADADHGDVSWSSGVASVEDLDCIDCIDAVDLKDTDAPGDEECLTYEATGTTMEWQACGAGSGDITDVFSCSTGDCSSITIAATDLLNLSGSDASTATEGLILPQHATACAGGTAEGQVCWEADADTLYVGNGATLTEVGAGGSSLDSAQMTRTAAQSINTGTWTKIAFDAEVFDNGGIADVVTNDRFDVATTDQYTVDAFVAIPGIDDGERVLLAIRVNTVDVRYAAGFSVLSNMVVTVSRSTVLDLTSGDYVELYAHHSEGAAQNTETSEGYMPRMSIKQVQ